MLVVNRFLRVTNVLLWFISFGFEYSIGRTGFGRVIYLFDRLVCRNEYAQLFYPLIQEFYLIEISNHFFMCPLAYLRISGTYILS